MVQDLQVVVRLQELDIRAGELQREIAALPKHIASIEKKLQGGGQKLKVDQAALVANQMARKKAEGDIQANEGKISKLKDQMLHAKTNEQYKAFQNEIGFCETEIRKSEDRILELMTASEPLERNVKSADVALKEEKKQVEAEKISAREQTAKDQGWLDQLMAERTTLTQTVPAAVLALYERIRKGRGGIAVAEAVEGRCSKCHVGLRPQFLQELKRGEKIMICESCQRIMIMNAPQSFEEFVGGTRA